MASSFRTGDFFKAAAGLDAPDFIFALRPFHSVRFAAREVLESEPPLGGDGILKSIVQKAQRPNKFGWRRRDGKSVFYSQCGNGLAIIISPVLMRLRAPRAYDLPLSLPKEKERSAYRERISGTSHYPHGKVKGRPICAHRGNIWASQIIRLGNTLTGKQRMVVSKLDVSY
jgi:hypothetical protein